MSSEGAIDPTFRAKSVYEISTNLSQTYAIAPLPGGRLLLGGVFASVNDAPRTNLAVVLSDGSLDPVFDARGADGAIKAAVSQPNGGVILAGSFSNILGAPRNKVARLLMDPPSAIRIIDLKVTGTKRTVTLQTKAGKRYFLESRTSLASGSWTQVTDILGTGENRELSDTSSPLAQQFYRVRVE
jgi:hypothetical protein